MKHLYPCNFEYTLQDYISLMRSLLIKATHDSALKFNTGYKGMYFYGKYRPCFTLKFDTNHGIFGFLPSSVRKNRGIFDIYYFPSPDEDLLEKSSVQEAAIASSEDFLTKIRRFSRFDFILKNFHIGQVHLYMYDDILQLIFKTQTKEVIISKDGIENIIQPGGKDKDFPSFRLMLVVINFLNLSIMKILDKSFLNYKVYKKTKKATMYDEQLKVEPIGHIGIFKICLNIVYCPKPSHSFEHLSVCKSYKEVDKKSSIYKFMETFLRSNDRKIKVAHKKAYKPKLIVVTGFLGSGKTQFLQNYIEHETKNNNFVGVIQNEIGTIGLDGSLLDYNYSMVELDEGCVCCSLSGQIKGGISLLSQKNPDILLLETTGVANPFNLLEELNEIENLVSFSSIVTIVDGVNFLKSIKKYQVLLEQIKAADIILLNKIDLISTKEKHKIKSILNKYNKCAHIFETTHSDIHPNLLPLARSEISSMANMISEECQHHDHSQDGIISIKKNLKSHINKNDFIDYVKALPDWIFRAKGVVSFSSSTKRHIFQFVNGKFELIECNEDIKFPNFLVFIGKNSSEKFYFPSSFSP